MPDVAGCGDTNFQVPLFVTSCSELANIALLGLLQVEEVPIIPCTILGGNENCRATCKVCEPEPETLP